MRSLSTALVFCFLLMACAPSLSHQKGIESNLLSHQYAKADRLVEENRRDYGKRNIVLYYLDRAMLLHLAGQYRESNAFFGKADIEMERLYTQSVTSHVGALLTNDNLLPYGGEDFERVLIHLFSALNYTALGELDGALVEARKVDARLNLINDRYDKKNVYKKDAFARYLAGILYETRGEVNNAFISYRKSYEAFKDYRRDYRTPIPSRLGLDLLRVTDDLHLKEEFDTYKKTFPDSFTQLSLQAEKSNEGEIIVLAYSGRSPVKEDFFIQAPIPDGDDGTYLLRIAMPKFVPHPSRVKAVEVILRQGEKRINKRLDLLEDITAIAKKNLEDRVARITAKAIARATSKFLATQAARRKARSEGGDQAGQLIGLLGNLFEIVTEQSDKRSWRTLPGRIYLGRISLPEGNWEAEIRYMTSGGGVAETRRILDLRIETRKKEFLIVQAIH